ASVPPGGMRPSSCSSQVFSDVTSGRASRNLTCLRCRGGLTADSFLDCVELSDTAQGLRGDRRSRRSMALIELTPHICPTGGQHDGSACGQPLEPGIAVDLEDAPEVLEMRG